MEKATATSPLNLRDGSGKVTHILRRKFLGNLFPKTTDEHNELKAYRKGNTHYTFKNEGVMVAYGIKAKEVRQEYYYEEVK